VSLTFPERGTMHPRVAGTIRIEHVAKTETIRARVEPALKERAEAILDRLGVTPTAAITMLYRQIVMRRGLPFDVSLQMEDFRD
jgi:addiction module RelB/DinJ family antitoxin